MNLASGVWKQLPDAPWGVRTGHAMVAQGESILMSGGGSCRSCIFMHHYADVWSFNASTEAWTQLPLAPWKPRWFHSMSTATNGDVIMAGGQIGFRSVNDVWKLSGGVWSELTQKAPWSARSQFAMTASPLHRTLVLAGGYDDAWLMDLTENPLGKWSKLPMLATEANAPVLAVFSDGSVIIAGGDVPCGNPARCGSQTFVSVNHQWFLKLNNDTEALSKLNY